jgi:hypothetical protein
LPDKADTEALETRLATLTQVDPSTPIEIEGKQYRWQPYQFSMRYGVEGDPGHEGYHGLKELVTDDFIALGKRNFSGTSSSYSKEDAGSRYYLWSSIATPGKVSAQAAFGGMKPAGVWLNHARLAKVPARIQLGSGANPLLLRYDSPGRGYFVMETGNAAPAAEVSNEIFSSAAFYIWYPNDKSTADRYFRKVFQVTKLPKQARLRITCDNAYAVYLNGKQVGRGSRWEAVQEYDVHKVLQVGANVIAVAGHNDGADAGLIAEIIADGQRLAATDASWLCAQTEEKGWLEPGFDPNAAQTPSGAKAKSNWVKAEQISSFEDSLWYKHQFGPPRLEASAEAEPESKPGSLAMRWYNKPGLLPFDTRPQETKPAGWYRFVSPPGLRSMTIVARGTVRAWADGKELKVTAGKKRDDGTFEFKATVPQPAAGAVRVALRLEQERGCYGGATIPEPIQLDCVAGRIATGDWSKMGVLECYSGGAWYRKSLSITAEQKRGRIILDLGDICSSAEIHLNGKLAGIRIAPPWKVDITDSAKTGNNRLEVLVYNTLGNHYLTIPTRYLGATRSGLIGPVRLEISD